MRTLLLAGTSLLALAAVAGSAKATPFGYTGKVETYSVPETGTYQIEAAVARVARRPTIPASLT